MARKKQTKPSANNHPASARPGEMFELTILKSAVENTNEAFVTINEEHRIVLFNQTAEKIFGYKRSEVIGEDLTTILGPACPSEHQKAVNRYINSRNPVLIGHGTELTASRKNGEAFPAFISFSVSEMEGKMFFTGLVRDLTEEKAVEEQFRRAEQLAALGQVVAEISHEIKNPLMMIGGFARQLLKHEKKEENHKKLTIIHEEVGRLEELVRELNALYLPRQLNLEQVDINGLLQETHTLSGETCRKKGLEVIKNFETETLMVTADRGKLKQVFLNLMKNGIEALDEGGKLTIETRLADNTAEIIIADDGPGIAKENMEKVLTPFFTTKRRGSGLGLPLSKRIIQDHQGGSFSISSLDGEGTRIKITLPLADPDQAELKK
ncbi:MAG: PAS domain S-box protein, partial [Deltaproteobacteria bacterium]|nr:PAS domain S-box protein [Deltaproteobacteria bacterium]